MVRRVLAASSDTEKIKSFFRAQIEIEWKKKSELQITFHVVRSQELNHILEYLKTRYKYLNN